MVGIVVHSNTWTVTFKRKPASQTSTHKHNTEAQTTKGNLWEYIADFQSHVRSIFPFSKLCVIQY